MMIRKFFSLAAVAALLLAALPACQPDTSGDSGTPGDPSDPGQAVVEQHETTYKWSCRDAPSLFARQSQIKASADSAQVSKIYLESDSTDWERNIKDIELTFTYIFDKFSEYGFTDSNLRKIEYSGVINKAVVADEQDRQDSIAIKQRHPKLTFINTKNRENRNR